MVSVELLGAPRITRDGAAVEMDTRKAFALLAYLGVTGRAHTRDSLAGLLWPEYDQEHARGALRRTLSALRKGVGPEWLEASRDTVVLKRGEGLRIDVDEFRARASGSGPEDLEEAVALYRDDLLAGFALRDSAPFEDWQRFEADSLRRELAKALDGLADAAAAGEDYAAAIAHARRRLSLNRLDEPAHRRLIELYARKGERAAAVRQYRECVRTLHRELGVGPVEETTSLYRRIQGDDPPAPANGSAGRPVPASPPEPSDAPLVGRADERAALLDAYASVQTNGRLVVIEGELGIGKTRLADDLLAALREQGAVTIAVRCYEDERTLAYAPVAEAARAAIALLGAAPEEGAGELGRLLPEAGPPSPHPLDSKGAQTRFFEALRTALEAAVEGPAPGVLLFDDVQYADEASQEFLTYLVRRLTRRPLLVVFTWRVEEVPPSHKLRRLIADKARSRSATVVQPRRLSPEEVEELAAALVSGRQGLTRAVYRDTRGLPLFAVEYLLALGRGDTDSPPRGVRDLLLARLASVSDLSSQVLTAAAVIGGRFDASTVQLVAGRTEEETVAALEELTAHGLIEESGDAYDFRHEQLREVASARTSLARRRLLHGRVGDTLGRTRAATGPTAAQIARHYALAGRDRDASMRFQEAGEHARSLYANAEALAHFQAALALGHPDAGLVHEAIGDVQTLLGDYAGALTSYEAAAADEDAARAAALEHKLAGLHLRRGDLDLAARHLAAALDAPADGEPGLHARILADAGLVAHRRGQEEAALASARRALADAEHDGDERTLAQVRNVLGILLKNSGQRAEARELLEESARWAEEHGDLVGRVAALNNLALVDRAEGDVPAALSRTTTALELADLIGDRHRQAALHNNLADILHASGRGDEAMVHLKKAVTLFAEIGETGEPQPEIWKLVDW
jgi:DNA-binding SARP family transcriptional activator